MNDTDAKQRDFADKMKPVSHEKQAAGYNAAADVYFSLWQNRPTY